MRRIKRNNSYSRLIRDFPGYFQLMVAYPAGRKFETPRMRKLPIPRLRPTGPFGDDGFEVTTKPVIDRLSNRGVAVLRFLINELELARLQAQSSFDYYCQSSIYTSSNAGQTTRQTFLRKNVNLVAFRVPWKLAFTYVGVEKSDNLIQPRLVLQHSVYWPFYSSLPESLRDRVSEYDFNKAMDLSSAIIGSKVGMAISLSQSLLKI